jgi:hypothetical protein
MERQREAAASQGGDYARRPVSEKTSIIGHVLRPLKCEKDWPTSLTDHVPMSREMQKDQPATLID